MVWGWMEVGVFIGEYEVQGGLFSSFSKVLVLWGICCSRPLCVAHSAKARPLGLDLWLQEVWCALKSPTF